MSDLNDIGLDDIKAMARKLEHIPGLDDDDRASLTSMLTLAAIGIAGEAEVSGFGSYVCSCVTTGDTIKPSPYCAVPRHRAAANLGW